MKRLSIVGIIGLLIITSLIPNVKASGPTEVTGQVTDEDTGQELYDVEIIITDLTTQQQAITYTNYTGHYSLDLDELGDWDYGDIIKIEPILEDYIYAAIRAILDEDWSFPTYNFSFALRPNPDSTTYPINNFLYMYIHSRCFESYGFWWLNDTNFIWNIPFPTYNSISIGIGWGYTDNHYGLDCCSTYNISLTFIFHITGWGGINETRTKIFNYYIQNDSAVDGGLMENITFSAQQIDYKNLLFNAEVGFEVWRLTDENQWIQETPYKSATQYIYGEFRFKL
jgi:hypothetical protein